MLISNYHLIDSVTTEVSLAVHRVGQTLLLDYLDVPALISYASEVGYFGAVN